jgi:hypothetical protein
MIVGAQNALQGAMVCALDREDTSGLSVLSDNSEKKWAKWLEESRDNPNLPKPKQELAHFDVLLKRCKAKLLLDLTAGQEADIKRLHDHFRNNFAHFTPKGWSIEKAGLPRIIGAALYAVENLMSQARVRQGRPRRLKEALRVARRHLKSMQPNVMSRLP